MSIATRIQSMYENVGEVYDTITNVTLPEHKNIENIPRTIRDSYLEIINNGINVIYDNWEKVIGEGTNLTLTPTEEAPMKIVLKGNTYQYSTSGKNKWNVGTLSTVSDAGMTFTPVYENGLLQYVNVNGTATANVFYQLRKETLPAGTYIINGCTGGSTMAYSLAVNFNTGAGRISQVDSELAFTLSEERTMTESFIRVGNGTTVNNVKIYPMIRLSSVSDSTYEPYTNGASPNPDYPQEIQVVSGDNSIKVEGKNLVSEDILNQYKVSEDSEAYIFNSNTLRDINLTPNTTFKANTQYTIQYIAKQTTGNPRLRIQYTDGTYDNIKTSTIATTYTKYTQLSTANKTIDFITETYTANTENSFYIKKNSFCIVEGNDTTYYPYTGASYPINLPEGMELCKIGTYQDKIDKSTGKNRLDISDITNITGLTNNNNTSITLNGSPASTSWALSKPFTLKANTTYTLSLSNTINDTSSTDRFLLRNGNDNIVTIYFKESSVSYTPTQDIVIDTLRVYTTGSYTFSNYTFSIMLNEGNTALPYEPYGTSWYLKKENWKYTFTGNENWTTRTTGSGWVLYELDISNNNLYATTTENIGYCNQYKPLQALSNNNTFRIQNGSMLSVRNDTIGSLSNFKTALGTNNLIIQFPYATPTYTLIEGELLNQLEAIKMSYEGQTNISQDNNDLASVLNASALKKV